VLSVTRPEGENVGPYVLTPAGLASTNYAIIFANGTLTINRKVATVAANPKSKTYGEANPALDATVTGAVGLEVLDYSLATTATTASGAADYPITVTLGANPNYDVTAVDSLLTVHRKAATVAANPRARPTARPTRRWTRRSPARSVWKSWTTVWPPRPPRPAARADYPITVTLGANPNYDVTAVDSLLTVHRKAATVAANPKSKTYGEANPALDATVTGAVGVEVLDYSLATTATPASGAADYPITVTLGNNPNYDVTAVDSLLTVHRKAATVAANPKSRPTVRPTRG